MNLVFNKSFIINTLILLSPMLSLGQNAIELSQDYLYAAKTEENVTEIKLKLKDLPFETFEKELISDVEKKAFWLNMYNATVLNQLKINPDIYSNRNRFYSIKFIEVAGLKLSLDQVEHDILRRSKYKYSLGYINKIFPSKVIKKLRVDSLDNRIHFALNCGARSCPAIAFYSSKSINNELDMATKAFLDGTLIFNGNTIEISRIFFWFRGDFGGKKGILKFLKKHKILSDSLNPKIKYQAYDWTMDLNQFRE